MYSGYIELSDTKEAIMTAIRLAECKWRLYRIEEGDSILNYASKINSEKLNNDNYIASLILTHQGTIKLLKMDYDGAIDVYNKALIRNQLHFDDSSNQYQINILFNLASTYTQIGVYDSAIHHYTNVYEEQLKYFKANARDTLHVDFVDIQINLCILEYNRGFLRRAKTHGQKAIMLLEQMGRQDGDYYADALSAYGRVVFLLGNYKYGLKLKRQALDIIKLQYGKESWKYLVELMELSDHYAKNKQFHLARNRIDEFFQIAGQNENFGVITFNAYNILGNINTGLGNHSEALKYYKESVSLMRKYKIDGTHLAPISTNVIQEYFELGDKKSFLKDYKTTLILVEEKLGRHSDSWYTLKTLYGKHLTETGKYAEAEKVLLKTLQDNSFDYNISGKKYRYYQNPIKQLKSIIQLIDLYKTWNEEDNEKLIIHQFQLGDSLIQQSRCLINNYEDQLNFSEEVRTFYSEATSHNIQLYEKKKDDHFLYQSFYFSEQSKAYILFNSLNNRELQDENHTSLYNELSDTQQLLSYYQARKNNNSLDSAKQFEINTSITNLLIRRDQLLSGINDNIFGNSNVKLGSFPDIKLKKNELLINYFDTGEELFAFLLQRDDLFFFKLEKKGTKDIIDSLRNYISYSKSNALSDPKRFQKIANIAFQKIIQPFSHKLEGMNLIISPDGYLNLIPFELLVRETKDLVSYSNIDYLIRNNNIQYTYSANILSILNQRSQNFQNQVLAISPQFNNTNSRVKNSIQWSPLPELNHTLTEIQNIGNYFDKVQQTGIEASETNFVLNADNFNILHLATHSINDFNDPMNSGVLFSKVPHDTLQDGVLYGYEIQFQRLNAEMVVLSACNTGVGKLVDGEGMISLANTFFYAGANSVVMSLWPVGDKSTSEIIKEFYRNLSEGYSKSESLRMAKLSYMETAPEIASSPYYWAGLVVNGNTRPIVSNSLDWYIWVTISFLLTGIGWIVYSWFGNRKQ